jgi:hypothetical protein
VINFRSIWVSIFVLILSGTQTLAQRPVGEENAALRYWSAFSVMQDTAIATNQDEKLRAVLEGKASYDDSTFKDLVEKNSLPLEIMTRATSLPECDWGLDPSFGGNEPVEYVRDALALGRLNVLYAFHLLSVDDKDAGVRTLVAGLRFSQDVAKGGTLFAALAADDLISDHLRAIAFAERNSDLSATQRSLLRKAVVRLGPDGLDWQSAIHLELQIVRSHFSEDPQASAAIARIESAYPSALRNPSDLPALEDAIQKEPAVSPLIANPKRVLSRKQDLTTQITETLSLLR